MTELEILARRRELVLLSAELQRATLVRRAQRIETNPARVAFGIATRAVSAPFAWRLGTQAVSLAMRAYRRRSRRRRPETNP